VYTTHILVRFGDLDAAGIAYYPNLVNFLHEAFEDFFVGHVGRPYPDVYREGIGFPTRKLEMEFVAPVHYGDRVRVDVAVEGIGRSSVRFLYRASVAGRAVFSARSVAVAVDMKDFRPMALPAWLRERLAAAMAPSPA
jgi:YbgC/YbaW family acyl-CoA thioester hydrolase